MNAFISLGDLWMRTTIHNNSLNRMTLLFHITETPEPQEWHIMGSHVSEEWHIWKKEPLSQKKKKNRQK